MKTDKILHLMAGYAIALTVGLWNPLAGLLAGIAIGAAKELIYDRLLDRGVCDVKDFLYTAAGAAAGFVMALIAELTQP